jgi:hypothetical protein
MLIQRWQFTTTQPRILGSGSFSDVLEMKNQLNHRAALKLYQRTSGLETVFDQKHFTDELTILNLLAMTPASIYVPQILAYDATVQYILLTPVGVRLNEAHVDRDLIIGLLDAMRAVHAYCIHRDLRAANILVVPGTPPRIKIIDWNLALRVEDLSRAHTPEGALGVQGTEIILAMLKKVPYVYSPRDDLQSLVRAIYLVFNPGTVAIIEVKL